MFSAEFVTLHRRLRAELTSPEGRLSDHLNASSPLVDIGSYQGPEGAAPSTESFGAAGQIRKQHLLFVVPIDEPPHASGPGNVLWKPTLPHRCWLGVGPYHIVGTLYLDRAAPPHAGLSMLDKQFLPLTDVVIMDPEGKPRDYPAILVNLFQADIIAILT